MNDVKLEGLKFVEIGNVMLAVTKDQLDILNYLDSKYLIKFGVKEISIKEFKKGE